MNRNEKRRSRRAVRSGTLLMLALLLFGSATLRIGVQAGPVLTQTAADLRNTGTGLSQPDLAGDQAPENLDRLLKAFQDREIAVQAREQAVEEKTAALKVAEQALENRVTQLVEAERRLSETLAIADSAAEDDLSQLTSVYGRMKPKDAAALFEEMNPQFAAGFLARMQPEIAASIMAGLSPKAAYTISVVLAGRHASVPRQ